MLPAFRVEMCMVQKLGHFPLPALPQPAEAVWKRKYLLLSLGNQEMLDEAFH